MKRILQGTLLLAWYMIAINAADQEIIKESTTQTIISEKKESLKKNTEQQKTKTTEKYKQNMPLKAILFVNSRVNNIMLVLTTDKNKQIAIPINMGGHYVYYSHLPLSKVVCHEKSTPKTTLTKKDLESYTTFVFNDDQKTDKYHHISIKHKNQALKHARQSKDITLFNDVCEETIYNP